MAPRPPRPCRQGRHAWRFTGTLITMLYADGSLFTLSLHDCADCHHALELGGAWDATTQRMQGLSAGVWGEKHGYTTVPLT